MQRKFFSDYMISQHFDKILYWLYWYITVSSSEHDSQSEDLINKNLVTALTASLIKHDNGRLNFLILEIFAEIAKTGTDEILHLFDRSLEL